LKQFQLSMPQGPSSFEPFVEVASLASQEWIALFPVGITLAGEPNRPIMLFKDQNGENVLPVPVSPLEAGITLGQANRLSAPVTPHRVAELILAQLKMKISACRFVEIRQAHQYVLLELTGGAAHTVSAGAGVVSSAGGSNSELKLRADEAVSLCLHLGVPFFATKTFIQKSRSMSMEVEDPNLKVIARQLLSPQGRPHFVN
jgi:uncharacterized protein